jgi:FKBP-type peptidyl-prolyl cis-trans isomerase SlyD
VHLKVHAVREAELQEVGQGSLGTGFFRLPASELPGDDGQQPAPTLH